MEVRSLLYRSRIAFWVLIATFLSNPVLLYPIGSSITRFNDSLSTVVPDEVGMTPFLIHEPLSPRGSIRSSGTLTEEDYRKAHLSQNQAFLNLERLRVENERFSLLDEEQRKAMAQAFAGAGTRVGEALKSIEWETLPSRAYALARTDVPKWVLFAIVASLGYKAGKKYIEETLFKRPEPKLVAKKSAHSWLMWLSSFIWKTKLNIEDYLVISAKCKEQFDYITKLTNNIRKNGGYFENVLLWGPPGTGKTLFAELLAQLSGLEYAFVPAANVAQFLKSGTIVQELNDLFNWAERSKGVLIFFDECETFLADRAKLSDQAAAALGIFLARTGKPSKNFMIVGATNRPSALDEAVLSRFMAVEVPLPTDAERKKLLKMHIAEVFTKQEGKKIAYDYFNNDANLNELSSRLEGVSGRSIQKFVNRVRQIAVAQDKAAVTQPIIEVALAQVKADQTLQNQIVDMPEEKTGTSAARIVEAPVTMTLE